MSKLTRGFVLGAMLAVLSSATAAAAPQQPLRRNEAVKEFRAGERASMGQPVSSDQAVQQFRAGERVSTDQPVSRDDAVQQFRSGEGLAPAHLGQGRRADSARSSAGVLRVDPPGRRSRPAGPGRPVRHPGRPAHRPRGRRRPGPRPRRPVRPSQDPQGGPPAI